MDDIREQMDLANEISEAISPYENMFRTGNPSPTQ